MKTKNRENHSPRTSRRAFTMTAAATLLGAPFAASFVQAQTPSTTKQTPAPPSPQPTLPPDKPSPLAEAYAAVAQARFGAQVTPEQFALIKKDLEGNVSVAERLRAVKLQNADEPDFVFKAD